VGVSPGAPLQLSVQEKPSPKGMTADAAGSEDPELLGLDTNRLKCPNRWTGDLAAG